MYHLYLFLNSYLIVNPKNALTFVKDYCNTVLCSCSFFVWFVVPPRELWLVDCLGSWQHCLFTSTMLPLSILYFIVHQSYLVYTNILTVYNLLKNWNICKNVTFCMLNQFLWQYFVWFKQHWYKLYILLCS